MLPYIEREISVTAPGRLVTPITVGMLAGIPTDHLVPIAEHPTIISRHRLTVLTIACVVTGEANKCPPRGGDSQPHIPVLARADILIKRPRAVQKHPPKNQGVTWTQTTFKQEVKPVARCTINLICPQDLTIFVYVRPATKCTRGARCPMHRIHCQHIKPGQDNIVGVEEMYELTRS